MSRIAIGVLIPFVIAFIFWVRGTWRTRAGDILLSGLVFAAASLIYIAAYGYGVPTGAPACAALLAGMASVVIAAIKRKKNDGNRMRMILATIAFALALGAYAIENRPHASSNSLMVLTPYRHAGTWVFDDPSTGLEAEPFVAGIPELLDKVLADAGVASPDAGFRLTFSAQPFPGHQTKVIWRRREHGGNWYYSPEYDLEGWLCPSLLKYFAQPPETIYVKADAIR